jgi:hypothetical protein
MKFSTLSMTLLLSASLLAPTFGQAAVKTKSKKAVVKLLTKDKNKLSDPQYQLKLQSIRQLTDEEALQYDVDYSNVVNKSLNLNDGPTILGNGFKIPSGVPGMEDGGFVPSAPEATPGKVINKGGNTGGLSVGTGAGGTVASGSMGGIGEALSGVLMVVDKLVAIGEKIMPTIEKGRPAVTNKPMAAISVLPRIDAKDPVVHEMGNWSIPVTKHYKITYSNGFGSTVVSFVYSITFQYNGTYGGKGKYLAGVRMSARDIQVDWGFDLDATSELIQISNVGTTENVIAGATVEISYTVKNVLRVLTTTESFHVTGDGRIYKLD